MPGILSLRRDRDYLFSAQTIVPSPGQKTILNGLLRVQEGRIAQIWDPASRQPQPRAAPSTERFDLGDGVLFPALIDAHLHLGIHKGQVALSALGRCFGCGIAAVRDGGDREGSVLGKKEALSKAGVRIYASGQAIRHRNGYGGFLGRGISNRDEFLEMLTHLCHQGADFIKIIASGVVDFGGGRLTEPMPFPASELKWMVTKARERGLPVMAHANANESVTAAVKAGVWSIEHGYLISGETVEFMAERGIYWIPTLLPVHRLGSASAPGKKNPPKTLENLRRIYAAHEQNILHAHALGVRLVAGTDAGAPGIDPGRSLYEELRLLVASGLSAEAALRAATLCSAQMLGGHSPAPWGALASGSTAHFLVLDPDWEQGLPWPENIRAIVAVQGGG